MTKTVTVKVREIAWLDAWGDHGRDKLFSLESVKGYTGVQRKTVGYVILDDKNGVLLAQDFFPEEGTFRNIIYIPKISIVKESG